MKIFGFNITRDKEPSEIVYNAKNGNLQFNGPEYDGFATTSHIIGKIRDFTDILDTHYNNGKLPELSRVEKIRLWNIAYGEWKFITIIND